MEDQVRGLVGALMARDDRRRRLASGLKRTLEIGSLAFTGGISSLILLWQL